MIDVLCNICIKQIEVIFGFLLLKKKTKYLMRKFSHFLFYIQQMIVNFFFVF